MTNKEAIKIIEELWGVDYRYCLGSREVEAVDKAIEALKQPEQKKGKWLSHYEYLKRKGYNPSGLIALWWCSQCERGVEHATNFCPNCGAKMEGTE